MTGYLHPPACERQRRGLRTPVVIPEALRRVNQLAAEVARTDPDDTRANIAAWDRLDAALRELVRSYRR